MKKALKTKYQTLTIDTYYLLVYKDWEGKINYHRKTRSEQFPYPIDKTFNIQSLWDLFGIDDSHKQDVRIYQNHNKKIIVERYKTRNQTELTTHVIY